VDNDKYILVTDKTTTLEYLSAKLSFERE